MAYQDWKKINESTNDGQHSSFHVTVLGDGKCGKSAFIDRLTKDTFTDQYFEYYRDNSTCTILSPSNKKVSINFRDTAGYSIFKSYTIGDDGSSKGDYKGVNGFLVIYDVTDGDSFDSVQNYLKKIECYASKNSPTVIAGTKSEGSDMTEVSSEDAQAFSIKFKTELIECSAKEDKNIVEVIAALTSKLLKEPCGKKNTNKGAVNVYTPGLDKVHEETDDVDVVGDSRKPVVSNSEKKSKSCSLL